MFNRMRGANAYSQVSLETAVQSADPHQLILMLYDGALMALAQAVVAMEQKDIPKRAQSISRAIAIIHDGLHASLDVESGGELGERLAALYDYMVERLTQANATNNAAAVQEVSGLLPYRFFRTHRLLHLTLVRRLVLVLRRRLTRCFLLPMHAIWGVVNPVNANFTYAFNIVIKVIVLRLFVIARLHTFQWAIAKHRGTFFTAGPETVYQ